MPVNKARRAEYERVRSRRRHAENPEPIRAASRRWAAANPERVREYARRWAEVNPRKYRVMLTEAQRRREARKLNQLGYISPGYEEILWRLQHGRCFHCAEPLDERAQVDHLRPLGVGGLHDDGNLALSCAPCNMGRPKNEDAGPGPLCYTMEGV